MLAEIDLGALLILLAAGLVMGAVNNLAGAAGALGMIVLEMAGSLDAIHANASLRPAAIAIGISGWIGFRTRQQAIPPRAWLYGALTIPGALAGAMLAVTLPAWVIRGVLATILVLVLLQQILGTGRPHPSAAGARRLSPGTAGLFVLIGLHMGFIQVATGLLSILVLSSVVSRDLVTTNAAKMAIIILSSTTAVAYFAISGNIVWAPALALAAGCGAGSFAASRWSVDKGHGAVRIVVITMTVAVLARLGWQLASTA